MTAPPVSGERPLRCAKKMTRPLTAVCLLVCCLCGCYSRISYSDLSAKIDRDAANSAPHITYQGTDTKDHYFIYRQYWGPTLVPAPIRMRKQLLKVPTESALIRNEFDLSTDAADWRSYYIGLRGREEFYSDLRPIQTGAQQNAAGQPATPQ